MKKPVKKTTHPKPRAKRVKHPTTGTVWLTPRDIQQIENDAAVEKTITAPVPGWFHRFLNWLFEPTPKPDWR